MQLYMKSSTQSSQNGQPPVLTHMTELLLRLPGTNQQRDEIIKHSNWALIKMHLPFYTFISPVTGSQTGNAPEVLDMTNMKNAS